MLIGSLKGLLATLSLGILAGCAVPCGMLGSSCESAQATTSPPRHGEAAAAVAGASAPPAQTAPAPRGPAAPEQTPQANTAPTRIALLLPLQSETLGQPAQAVRDGFLAAYEHDRDGMQVEVVATADTPEDTVAAYRRVAAHSDIVVGPLARTDVGMLAASKVVTKPTIALNHPEQGVPLPPRMLAIGLSIEDEARQAADWAAREHPEGRALILAGNGDWQRRAAQAFELRWSELGRTSHTAELPADGGRVDADALDVVRTRMEVDPPGLMFAALDASELRQVRAVLGTATTCYAASPANPGRQPADAAPELDGLRLLDLPWEVQPDQQAVMVYPHRAESVQTLEIDRLYALGIDAFRVARALAQHPDAPVELDGVTGKLSAALKPPASFQRLESAAIYHDGAFEAAPSP